MNSKGEKTMRILMMTAALLAASAPVALSAKAMPAARYLMKAGASDLFEIQSAKTVMDSRNPKIHDFAQMMVTDHTQSTDMVKTAATQAGLHPAPPHLTPKQTSDLAALRRAQGPARDALYIRQQKVAHSEALMVQSGYASGGSVKPLRMAASQIVPVVKHHIAMLRSM
jgi:putative membrane protein